MLYLMGVMLGAGVVLGYIVASVVFLRFPRLLHKKKRQKFTCRHISHRGGAGENLENTITAFRHAVDLGTDMLEIDCQITRDNQVVVSHDNVLKRVAGQKVKVSDLHYQSLPNLKSEIEVEFSPGHVTSGTEDRRIPLLEDVFREFPNTPINVDCKENNDVLMQKISNLIRAYNRQDLTVWGNRDDSVNKKLYKLDPTVPLLFSMKRVFLNAFFFYTGLLPFLNIQEEFYEIPMPNSILPFIPPDSSHYCLKKTVLKIFDFLLMSKVMFKYFERRGIQVYLWVLNDDASFKRAFDLGATGVMTDFPTRLMHYMQENGMTDVRETAHDDSTSSQAETRNLTETECLTGGQLSGEDGHAHHVDVVSCDN